MAKTNFMLQSGIADDATFRAVGLKISQAFDAVGFVKTADTGQIDWATVTKPTTYPTMAGYEMRQLPAGVLQTANPVIVKIWYGTSDRAANILGMQWYVGHASSGSGGLTGAYSQVLYQYSYGNSASGNLNFISCDEEHFSMGLFLGIAGTSLSYYCILTIDRLRDENGTALDTGINVFALSDGTPSQFILPSAGAAQFPATALTTPMALYPPLNGDPTMGLGMCFSYIYPYMGCSGNPDLNLIIYPGNAMQAPGGTLMDFDMYGETHTYVLCGSCNQTLGSNGSAYWSVGVRYE